jgi:hypothetical protein
VIDREDFAPSPSKRWRVWYVADGGRDGRYWAVREDESPGPIQSFDRVVLKDAYGHTVRENERGYLVVEGVLGTVVQPGVGHVAIIGRPE